MNIDLDKICKDFINKKVEINDIIKKYNINYFKLAEYIKKYCFENGILIDEEITRKLEIPIKEMVDLRRNGMSYERIAAKYNYSFSITTITNKLKDYCKDKNIKLPESVHHSISLDLPMKDVYKMKKQGTKYKKIAEKYSCSISTIRRRLREYEEELVLRNRYLEILLYDFNKIIDNKSSEEQCLSYSDKGNKKQDDYLFIKNKNRLN